MKELRPKKVSARDRSIVAEVERGGATGEIVRRFGVTRERIRQICYQHGFRMPANDSSTVLRAESRRVEIRRLADSGMPRHDISVKLGLSRSTVSSCLEPHNRNSSERYYKAVVLLMTTDMALLQVAKESGFSSAGSISTLRDSLEKAGATLGRHGRGTGDRPGSSSVRRCKAIALLLTTNKSLVTIAIECGYHFGTVASIRDILAEAGFETGRRKTSPVEDKAHVSAN